MTYPYEPCMACQGGQVNGQPCPVCLGHGVVNKPGATRKRTRTNRTRTRAEINAEHRELVKAGKLALTREFRRDVYVDDLTQWEGTSDEGYHVKAGMAWGTFDLFICAKGKVIWADAKTGGATLSPSQIDFQRWIRAAGGVAESFHSEAELVALVRKVMG